MKTLRLGLIALLVVIAALAFSLRATETKNYGPISLQAIAEKEFDGRDLKRVKVLAENKYYTRYEIRYMSGDLSISGIMNVPKGEGKFPVIILNHGYINTRYYTLGRGLKREQDYLAKAGYVVIHTDYRNHAFSDKDPENNINMRMGYLEDVINAVYAVRNSKYDFVDKENIGMLGHSLGGGICLGVMVTKPDLVKAHVLFAPISADYRDNFERWIAKDRPLLAEAIIQKFGPPEGLRERFGSPRANPDFWDNISPLNFLDNVETPVMVHHGTTDKSVPVEWSYELKESFKKHGKEMTFYVYLNEPHEFVDAWSKVMERTTAFFDKYLK
jgi:dipeptidyl aminopeptidase/acylaminoacyl peptidase